MNWRQSKKISLLLQSTTPKSRNASPQISLYAEYSTYTPPEAIGGTLSFQCMLERGSCRIYIVHSIDQRTEAKRNIMRTKKQGPHRGAGNRPGLKGTKMVNLQHVCRSIPRRQSMYLSSVEVCFPDHQMQLSHNYLPKHTSDN